MQSFLVPLDGSGTAEQILPLTIYLAKALNCKVHLLHIVNTGAQPFPWERTDQGPAEQLTVRQERQSKAYLERVTARLAGSGVAITNQVVLGTPAEEITLWAATHPAELIAMTTHGRSGLARWMLGSVVDRVLRSAAQPVLLYHPKARAATGEPDIESILLPLDGTPEAEAAIPMATKLAGALNRPISLARVVSIYSFAFSIDAPETTRELIRGMTEEAAEYLSGTVKRLKTGGVVADTSLIMGEPSTGILEWAGEHRGGLLVMRTHAQSSLPRAVLGSVTDKVVRSGSVPMLLIPPAATAPKDKPQRSASIGVRL